MQTNGTQNLVALINSKHTLKKTCAKKEDRQSLV